MLMRPRPGPPKVVDTGVGVALQETTPVFNRSALSSFLHAAESEAAESMAQESGDRQYDIVVFGASGYTGQFVNEELYRIQNEGKRTLKWAAAGRTQSKLEAYLRGMV